MVAIGAYARRVAKSGLLASKRCLATGTGKLAAGGITGKTSPRAMLLGRDQNQLQSDRDLERSSSRPPRPRARARYRQGPIARNEGKYVKLICRWRREEDGGRRLTLEERTCEEIEMAIDTALRAGGAAPATVASVGPPVGREQGR